MSIATQEVFDQHLPTQAEFAPETAASAEVLTDSEVEATMNALTQYLAEQVTPETNEALRSTPMRKGRPGNDGSGYGHS